MEPERNIEKLLRACAKKRAAEPGASLQLHPATRRLLQGEVARRGSKPQRESLFFLRFLGDCRPGLALALSVMVVIAFGGALVLPSLGKAKHRAMSLSAMNNLRQIGAAAQMFAEDNTNRLPASLADVQRYVGSTNAFLDPVSGKQFVYIGAGRQLKDVPPDALLAYSPGNGKERTVLFADGSVRGASEKQFAEYKTATGANPAPGLNSQQFVQFHVPSELPMADGEKVEPLQKTVPVLASFQLSQNGNEIQVVDGDGSIYRGSLQPADVAADSRPGAVNDAVNTRAPTMFGGAGGAAARREGVEPPMIRSYFFRVSGTNQILKQNVLFTGELLMTNRARPSQGANLGVAPFAGSRLPLGNMRLSGTIVIDNGSEYQVQAQPAPP